MTEKHRPPVVLLLVDGLGFDQLNAGTTPFLSEFTRHGSLLPVRPVLGYSDAQRAVVFTGLNPRESGYWMQYRFSRPAESPWRALSALSFADRLPGDLFRRVFKFGLSATVMRLAARVNGHSSLAIHNIPFRALRWHRPSMRNSEYDTRGINGADSLFSLLNRQGRAYSVVRSDTTSALLRGSGVKSLARGLNHKLAHLPTSTSFVYLYIHTPDLFAHRYGLRDGRYANEVSAVDGALSELIGAVRPRLGADTEVVIVSDHGMNHTDKFIDLRRLVFNREFGKSYVAALDSTMVRFRYLNAEGRQKAREQLEDASFGRFLSGDDRAALGIDLPGDVYGDDIFLVEPGASIYPNFHSLMRPLAMHAYHPDTPDQLAFLASDQPLPLLNGSGSRTIEMADVHRVVRDGLALGERRD